MPAGPTRSMARFAGSRTEVGAPSNSLGDPAASGRPAILGIGNGGIGLLVVATTRRSE